MLCVYGATKAIRPVSAGKAQQQHSILIITEAHLVIVLHRAYTSIALCFCANCISIHWVKLLQEIRVISYEEILSHLHHVVCPRLSHVNLLSTQNFVPSDVVKWCD